MPRLTPDGKSYNKASVERALTHHFGSEHWRRHDISGYEVLMAGEQIVLPNLKTAALVVYGCAQAVQSERLRQEQAFTDALDRERGVQVQEGGG